VTPAKRNPGQRSAVDEKTPPANAIANNPPGRRPSEQTATLLLDSDQRPNEYAFGDRDRKYSNTFRCSAHHCATLNYIESENRVNPYGEALVRSRDAAPRLILTILRSSQVVGIGKNGHRRRSQRTICDAGSSRRVK